MPFKAVLGDWDQNISSLPNHDRWQLTSVLRIFTLGKFPDHFWKVKSNPEFLAIC